MARNSPEPIDGAEAARRLQETEAMGADAEHVAGVDLVSMVWSRAEHLTPPPP